MHKQTSLNLNSTDI